MTLKVNLYNGEKAEWDGYVYSHPQATNYHQLDWKEVIEKSFGHRTFYLLVKDGKGNIKGILPLVYMKSMVFGRYIVSMPFLNYGGILCDNGEVSEFLLKEAEKLLKDIDVSYIELRHFKKYDSELPTKEHKVTMILGLEENTDSQWDRFDAKLKNQIRKAIKSGLKIKVGHLELLKDFYTVFSRNMRDLGTPVYSKEFFKNVLQTFPASTKLFAVSLENRVIASGIATWYKDTLEVPWASSIRDYSKLCPNNLLYWETIRFAINNGFKKFDFGRSTKGEGTYRFKEQWGAKPVQLYWQYIMRDSQQIPDLTNKNPGFQIAINLWKRLPVRLTRVIGPGIVRCIP